MGDGRQGGHQSDRHGSSQEIVAGKQPGQVGGILIIEINQIFSQVTPKQEGVPEFPQNVQIILKPRSFHR